MTHIDVAAALARWRDIERQLQEAEAGTPEAEQLQAEASELRHLVQQLTSPPTGQVTEATA